MYSNDYDDTAIPDISWGGDWPINIGGTNFTMWSYQLYPYLKSSPIDQDPLQASIGPVPAGWAATWWYGYDPEFGYNYNVWCPAKPPYSGTNWGGGPISLTSVARPADVPVFTEHVGSQALVWWGPGGPTTLGTVEAPYCNPDQSIGLCFTSWGQGDMFTGFGPPYSLNSFGATTGGVVFGKGNNSTGPVTGFTTTTFGDGHAKFMSPGSLAVGTNWNPLIQSNQVMITDLSIYKWTVQ
jgi:hypothetical protein